MKILLDANISHKLVNKLKPVFGECAHEDLIGLNMPAQDIDIWKFAKENGYIIISKDGDFLNLLQIKGFPPKIVLLETGNNSSKALFELLINKKQAIEELENNEYGLLEIV